MIEVKGIAVMIRLLLPFLAISKAKFNAKNVLPIPVGAFMKNVFLSLLELKFLNIISLALFL